MPGKDREVVLTGATVCCPDPSPCICFRYGGFLLFKWRKLGILYFWKSRELGLAGKSACQLGGNAITSVALLLLPGVVEDDEKAGRGLRHGLPSSPFVSGNSLSEAVENSPDFLSKFHLDAGAIGIGGFRL